MNKIDYVQVPIEAIKHVTDKAVLVETAEADERWIPRSVLPVHIDDELVEGMYTPAESLTVARWFAEKEGFI